MKTILLFTLVILAVAISGCQDKKKVRNTNTQKEAVKVETKAVLIKDTIQVTETKTVTETTVVKEAPEYLLVGGCFLPSKTMPTACTRSCTKKAMQTP